MSKPANDEYAPEHARYVDLVSEDDIIPALEKQGQATNALLSAVTEERAGHRYAPGKWSIKQVVNHMADAERIFCYRALSVGRGDTRGLLGFDEEAFGAASEADRRPMADIVAELAAIRRATIALFRSFSDAAWKRAGTANDRRITVRGVAFVTLGHERHHLKVLRAKYQV